MESVYLETTFIDLLTWNCRHLANAQIVRRIEVVCDQLSERMPLICTPEELMGN
jgi:hypothetical protein